jgi:hypothetical protein
LEELLTATQDGARKDPDTYKPNDTQESDSAIHELMKKVLYDAHPEQADTSVATAVLGEGGAMDGGDSEGRDSPTVGNKRIFSIGTLSLGSLRIVTDTEETVNVVMASTIFLFAQMHRFIVVGVVCNNSIRRISLLQTAAPSDPFQTGCPQRKAYRFQRTKHFQQSNKGITGC